jgi:hypothetical protein
LFRGVTEPARIPASTLKVKSDYYC